MLKVNFLFGLFLLGGVAAWVIFADLGGYTSRSALIVARSTSVVSTIDGQVSDVLVTVGANVAEGAPLVTIRNDRIDRSRLTELRSQREFLKQEVITTVAQAAELDMMMKHYGDKASAYLDWLIQDLDILHSETSYRLKAAEDSYRAKAAEVEQTAKLVENSQISAVVLEQAELDAAIKRNKVEALRAELARVDLRISTVRSSDMLLENGSTSYWDETRNSLAIRLLENHQHTATMQASLAQIEDQVLVEEERVGNTFTEEHKAQFDGVINAVLTSPGERVIQGTNLLEVLDCANPIAIVAVPDHRFGDFYIGQKATIKPLDSEERIVGAVQHISSSALISRDTSIATSPDLQVGGNKIIVAFQNQEQNRSSTTTCDTARRAVVTIETETLLSDITAMVTSLLESARPASEPEQTAAIRPNG